MLIMRASTSEKLMMPSSVPGGCQMGVRWVSDGCQMGVRWVSDGCQMGVRWVSDGCQMGAIASIRDALYHMHQVCVLHNATWHGIGHHQRRIKLHVYR
jgi:hypothetical protein